MPPWEKYQAPAPANAGPWSKYAAPSGLTPEQQARDAEVRSGENPRVGGTFLGSERLGRLSDQVMDPFGVFDEVSGAGAFVRGLVTSGGSLDEAKKAYTEASERQRAERRVAREENSIVPEIVGGFGTSGPVKAVGAIAPTLVQGLTSAAKTGAAYGGASGFAQGEGGVTNRLMNAGKGAAIGGVAGPAVALAVPAVGRTVGAAKDAFSYANQAVRNAMNPEQAAINNVADRMVSQGINPAAVRAEISPPPSSNLTSRNFTEADLADILSRGLKGEAASDIGKAYGLHESTVRSYLAKYRGANPTDRNILDIATDMSGAGTAKPLTRLARAAYSLSDDGEAAQRLLTRQQTQAGRVTNIIDSAGAGRNFDDEVTRLSDVVSNQARQAYAKAEAGAQPFDIKPIISKYRKVAFARAGELREKTEQALDAFFEPVMGADGKVLKLGQAISDVKRFQAARQDLDQMIARSMQDGRPTPLTRNLTALRKELTETVRKANPELAKADDLFSGAKSSEKLLERGAELTGRLGAPSREVLDGFEKLSKDQQELVRLGFLKSLQDKAGNVRDGNAVAAQFNSPAVRQTIERLFPKSQKDAYKRGQELIKFLRQEATTTQVKNEVLSGSRTAELGSDMSKLSEGAQTAADLATGRFMKVLGNLSTRLTTQLGERGSKEVLDILTQTDPALLLPTLNRLVRSAQNAQQRRAYVTAVRELRALNLPAISGVVGQQSSSRPEQRR